MLKNDKIKDAETGEVVHILCGQGYCLNCGKCSFCLCVCKPTPTKGIMSPARVALDYQI